MAAAGAAATTAAAGVVATTAAREAGSGDVRLQWSWATGPHDNPRLHRDTSPAARAFDIGQQPRILALQSCVAAALPPNAVAGIVDTGTIEHVAPSSDGAVELRFLTGANVVTCIDAGNNQHVARQAFDYGGVLQDGGEPLVIKGVLVVPSIGVRLLSVRRLFERSGTRAVFDANPRLIQPDGTEFKLVEWNGLFALITLASRGTAALTVARARTQNQLGGATFAPRTIMGFKVGITRLNPLVPMPPDGVEADPALGLDVQRLDPHDCHPLD
ncbi:hypothetical protein M885DRAFT_578105 [Pelagophyceae sp. CCMP2097]|nr:hypothetical protein M885DRAFT_578105 [Pelagophyceae sp. CCMP2097]